MTDCYKNLVMVSFERYLLREHKTSLIREIGTLRGPEGALNRVLEDPNYKNKEWIVQKT